MADHSKDVEEQRAQIREKLPEDPEAEEEQAVDDASLALRLAKQLGVPTKPLPGGSGPCKLWVIAGPARGPGE